MTTSPVRVDTSAGTGIVPRLKIAFVTSGLGSTQGGIGVASASMVKALQAGHDVQLWHNDVRFPRLVRQAAVIGKAWTSEKPDFVFYGHVWLAAIHAVTPRLRNVPYGVFLHGWEIWQPLNQRQRGALEAAAVLVANSQYTVDRARRQNPWLPAARVAWLGVPTDVPTISAGMQPPIALMVGRLVSSERGKGHDEVLTAWPTVRHAVPGARLVLVGDGDGRSRLEERVRHEGISGVDFCGFVPDDEREHIYLRARTLLFPSTQEGFGLVLAEAAAHAMPSLALRDTVFGEIFPEGNGVMFINTTAPGDLGPAIIRLLTDDAFATATGSAARRRVEDCFSESHFASRFRGALKPLVP